MAEDRRRRASFDTDIPRTHIYDPAESYSSAQFEDAGQLAQACRLTGALVYKGYELPASNSLARQICQPKNVTWFPSQREIDSSKPSE